MKPEELVENLTISLYVKGMSTTDIEEQIRELYNFNISSSTISRITDKITSDIIAWKNRPLEATYLITATDNLNGFTDTIKTVFPNSVTQICMVHQIRNSCKYVVWKDKKVFTKDMKQIYTAPTKEATKVALEDFKIKLEQNMRML